MHIGFKKEGGWFGRHAGQEQTVTDQQPDAEVPVQASLPADTVHLSLGDVVPLLPESVPLPRDPTEDELLMTLVLPVPGLFSGLARGKVEVSLAALVESLPVEFRPGVSADPQTKVALPLSAVVSGIDPEAFRARTVQMVRRYDLASIPDPFQVEQRAPTSAMERQAAAAHASQPAPRVAPPGAPAPAVQRSPAPVLSKPPVPTPPVPVRAPAVAPAAPVPPPAPPAVAAVPVKAAAAPVQSAAPQVVAQPLPPAVAPAAPVPQAAPPVVAAVPMPAAPAPVPPAAAPVTAPLPPLPLPVAAPAPLTLPVAPKPGVVAAAGATEVSRVVKAPAMRAGPPAAALDGFALCDRLGGVDLNTATVGQLTSLDGVSAAVADKIIAYRQAHGSFSNVFELFDIPTIGRRLFRRITGMPFNERRAHRRWKLAALLKLPSDQLHDISKITAAVALRAGFAGCVVSDMDGMMLAQSGAAAIAQSLSAVVPRLLAQVRENMLALSPQKVNHTSVCLNDRMFTIIVSGGIYLTAIHEKNKLTKTQFVFVQRVAAEVEWLLSHRAYAGPIGSA